MEIDEHIGCAMSGLIADARTLVEHARVETQVPHIPCQFLRPVNIRFHRYELNLLHPPESQVLLW